MKIRGFRYFMSEASKNVFSNGWMSLASIFTVLASLLVFGFFLVLTVNLNYIATQLEGDYEIILIVDEAYNKEQVKELGEKIKAVENVKDLTLNTKESRLKEWKAELGAELLEGYEENNPLRDWYMLTLEDLSQADTTIESIEGFDGIAKIVRNQDTIDKLVTMTNYLGRVSVWVMIALALVSVFIISNTIKLTVFTRSKEINIMKFVGATDWFIRWPFIIEGIIIGLIGAIISFIVVAYGYQGILGLIGALDISFVKFKPFSSVVLPLIGAFIGLGVVLGGLGSLISVRKHLKV
ncbi:MAG: permease-like cell division protein FtsX [Clostridia bacterium]|nr:permease-like cell division protein FtsX [Clostridia bacterium]